jgi:uncharacterized protein YndB with AHSA1/START domain
MSERAGKLALVARRFIRASPERLFEAWTTPELLRSWWGPRGVRCVGAEVDLRVGGRYRLANALDDGRVLFIHGEFEVIERPRRLVYSWALEPGPATPERVTVRFEPRADDGTEVIVVHEHIADERTRDGHDAGWIGCLERLADIVGGPTASR